MKLSIRSLSDPGQEHPFSGSIDLSSISRWGQAPFPTPVLVTGVLHPSLGDGMVELDYTVSYRLVQPCARCLETVEQEESLSFSHLVAEALPEEEDDWIEAPGGMLDMDSLVASDLLLELDAAFLCREDCLGLCPICGKNKNLTSCDCDRKKPVDPRFAALVDLLQEE